MPPHPTQSRSFWISPRLWGLAICGSASCAQNHGGEASLLHDAGAHENAPDAVGSTVQSDAGTQLGGAPPVSTGSQCAAHSQLTASMLTITTPDPNPKGPLLASSASGSDLLAVWSDGGGTVNSVAVPESIWAVGLSLGASGSKVGSPIQLTADGHCPVAAATSEGFTLVWADATGIQLQRLDARGAVRGKSSLVVASADRGACPSSLLDTSDGLVVAWYEPSSTNQVVARLDASGAIAAQLILDQVPITDSAQVMLLSLRDQTLVARARWKDSMPASVISAIDWSKGLLTEKSVTPGLLQAFFASGDDLVLAVRGSQGLELFAGPLGASPGVWARESGAFSATADACGRVVALGEEVITPGGIAEGFFAEALDPPTAKVALGAVTEAALTGAGSRFGVLWYARVGPSHGFPGAAMAGATGTLNFTTLTWQ